MKQWYLLAYDIRNARRSTRLHKALKKRALPMQGSVFLLRVDEAGLEEVRALVTEHAHMLEDDVRIYPLKHPDELWLAGAQQNSFNGLYAGKPGEISGNEVAMRLDELLGK